MVAVESLIEAKKRIDDEWAERCREISRRATADRIEADRWYKHELIRLADEAHEQAHAQAMARRLEGE